MLWWGLAYIFVKMLAAIAELEADIIRERTLAFLLPGSTLFFLHLSYFQPRYHVKILTVTYTDQGKRKDYMDKHFIPDTGLKLLDFDSFIEKRSDLIFNKLKSILSV
jgi:hypothetical protein